MSFRGNCKNHALRLSGKVKDFLLKHTSREFLIFLFFFLMAAAFWLLQTLNNEFEADFVIPIHLKNVPDNVTLTSEPPTAIHVGVKDRGFVLLNYLVGKHFHPINLNFDSYKVSGDRVIVRHEDLADKVTEVLNATSRLLYVKPDTLEYIYTEGNYKKIPVAYLGKVTAEMPYYVCDTIFSPDSVIVYAPVHILDSLAMVYTNEVNFSQISDTAKQTVPLHPVKGAKYVPESVDLTFITDIYTHKTVEVPILGVGFPHDKVLRTFPSKAQVSFQVGLRHFQEINARDFSITIPYEDLLETDSEKYTLNVQSYPTLIRQVSVTPEQVDYLIEQVEADD